MEQKFYQNENGVSRFPLEDLSAIMMDLHYKTGNNMNIALGIRFQGKLNPEKLEKAIQRLYDCNDAFRMMFYQTETGYEYSILNEYTYHLEITETEGDTEEARFADAKAKIDADAQNPIDLLHELGVRFRCFRIGEKDHIIYVNAHHVIFDSASLFLTIQELITNYMTPGVFQRSVRQKNNLLQYYQDMDELKRTKGEYYHGYWGKEIAGYERQAVTPPEKKLNADSQLLFHISLPKAKLEKTARKMKVSPFGLMMAAYHLGLDTVFQRKDTVVGFSFVERTDPKYKDTIGPLVVASPNRITFDPEEGALDFIRRVTNKIYENMKYAAYIPIETQITAQFMVSYANTGNMGEGGGITPVIPYVKRKYDDCLMLDINNTRDTIEFDVQCDLTLYQRDEVARIIDITRRFLEDEHLMENLPLRSYTGEENGGLD